MRERHEERERTRGREREQPQALGGEQQPSREFGGAGRLGQLLDEFFAPWGGGAGVRRAAWPAVDVDEDDDRYCVCVELPGMRPEDLDVEVNQDVVTVRGEKRRNEEMRSRWSERSYGRFVRSFSLPADADPDATRAEFRDGVLTLSFPKREQARPRRVEIQGQEGGAQRVAASGARQEREREEADRPQA